MRNLVTFALLLLFICYSCDGVPQTRAIYDFAMNFYVKSIPTEVAEASDVNFVFSPFSMHTALSLLTCGATSDSDTEDELLSALGGFVAKEKIKDFYKNNLLEYKSNYTDSLQYANGLFTSSDFSSSILNTYKTMAKQIFDSEFIKLPANNPAQLVNNWVAHKTQSKITNLFNELSPDLALLLVNAVYFKGTFKT